MAVLSFLASFLNTYFALFFNGFDRLLNGFISCFIEKRRIRNEIGLAGTRTQNQPRTPKFFASRSVRGCSTRPCLAFVAANRSPAEDFSSSSNPVQASLLAPK